MSDTDEHHTVDGHRGRLSEVIVGDCFPDSCVYLESTADTRHWRRDATQALARKISECVPSREGRRQRLEYVPKEQPNRERDGQLHPTADKGKLVGYCEDSPVFRVLTEWCYHRVVRSRNVTFPEAKSRNAEAEATGKIQEQHKPPNTLDKEIL